MRRSLVACLAIGVAAGLSMAPALTAADRAGRALVRIDVTGQGGSVGSAKFNLLLDNGLRADSGQVAYKFTFGSEKTASNGQYGASFSGTDTLKGRDGRIVIHSSGRTAFTGAYEVFSGTWSVVNGTGKYGRLKGGGPFVTVITRDNRYSFRYEGFVTGS